MSENPKQKLIQESLRTRNSYCGVYGWKYRCNQIRMAQDSQTKHEINFLKNTFLSNSHDGHHTDTHDPVGMPRDHWSGVGWGGHGYVTRRQLGVQLSPCHPELLTQAQAKYSLTRFFPVLPSLPHTHTHTYTTRFSHLQPS